MRLCSVMPCYPMLRTSRQLLLGVEHSQLADRQQPLRHQGPEIGKRFYGVEQAPLAAFRPLEPKRCLGQRSTRLAGRLRFGVLRRQPRDSDLVHEQGFQACRV